jgi:uncharacterized membrane protein YfcA
LPGFLFFTLGEADMHGALASATFVASVVNGALGYGFSSITVPLALIFLTNRVLNPALVLVEVVLNAYVLWVNRAAAPAIARRVWPLAAGILPGVVIGTLVLSTVNPGWLKLWTFVVLLPLIMLQAAGFRRPIRRERATGVVIGGGVGALYAVTTVSGPPLAALLSNQGFVGTEFRAAMGLIRLVESSLTAVAYAFVGLYTVESLSLIPAIVPSLVIGVPIGAWLIRRVDAETFRRVCMSFDAWIVSIGIGALLRSLGVAGADVALAVPIATIAIDLALLYRFFFESSSPRLRRPTVPPPAAAIE